MLFSRLGRSRIRGVVLVTGLALCLTKAYGMDMAEDKFIFGSDDSSNDLREVPLTMTKEDWTFTVAGGKGIFNKGSTGMTTPDAHVPLNFATETFELNFPGKTYTADNFDDGYGIQLELDRQMNSWASLGIQAGASFGYNQQVETGNIPFFLVDSLGNLISVSEVTYSVKYKVDVYNLTPMLTLGHYIPLGRFAWKPYVTGGLGANFIHERVVLNTTGVDFDIGERTTTEMGALLGGGIDFRINPSGSIGFSYLAQRVLGGSADWTFSQPSLRFSYLF